MKRFVLDTNHASALMLCDPRLLLKRNSVVSLQLCMPVVGELWYMIYNSGRVDSNRVRLESFLAMLQILPYSQSAAEEFGRVQSECRKMGKKVPQIDAQIAAITRTYDCTLLTADRHFDDISGLSTENWLN